MAERLSRLNIHLGIYLYGNSLNILFIITFRVNLVGLFERNLLISGFFKISPFCIALFYLWPLQTLLSVFFAWNASSISILSLLIAIPSIVKISLEIRRIILQARSPQLAQSPPLSSGNVWARDGRINKHLVCMKMTFSLETMFWWLICNFTRCLLQGNYSILRPIRLISRFLPERLHLGQPLFLSVICVPVCGIRFCFVISS